MKIALASPPMLRIPPRRYAGTERVVAALGEELHRRGHEVTLFAPGDSEVPYNLEPTVERALWPAGFRGDPGPWIAATAERVRRDLARFDVVHSHLETFGLPLAGSSTPVVSTMHGRLDIGENPRLLAAFRDAPLVAISNSQRRWCPENRWVATIGHGLPFPAAVRTEPGEYLALVGRATHEKGVQEAIELGGRSGRRLVIAAKAIDPPELAFVEEIIRPAMRNGHVDFLGEIPTEERDEVLGNALATVMLGAWPEPFGLVAIESLALGTPVIARRAGALPEIIEHGVDGFLVDDLVEAQFAMTLVGSLDRARIAARARERFSVGRMVDRYEEVYRRLIGDDVAADPIAEESLAEIGALEPSNGPARGGRRSEESRTLIRR